MTGGYDRNLFVLSKQTFVDNWILYVPVSVLEVPSGLSIQSVVKIRGF